jgi:hypothetical protein
VRADINGLRADIHGLHSDELRREKMQEKSDADVLSQIVDLVGLITASLVLPQDRSCLPDRRVGKATRLLRLGSFEFMGHGDLPPLPAFRRVVSMILARGGSWLGAGAARSMAWTCSSMPRKR